MSSAKATANDDASSDASSSISGWGDGHGSDGHGESEGESSSGSSSSCPSYGSLNTDDRDVDEAELMYALIEGYVEEHAHPRGHHITDEPMRPLALPDKFEDIEKAGRRLRGLFRNLAKIMRCANSESGNVLVLKALAAEAPKFCASKSREYSALDPMCLLVAWGAPARVYDLLRVMLAMALAAALEHEPIWKHLESPPEWHRLIHVDHRSQPTLIEIAHKLFNVIPVGWRDMMDDGDDNWADFVWFTDPRRLALILEAVEKVPRIPEDDVDAWTRDPEAIQARYKQLREAALALERDLLAGALNVGGDPVAVAEKRSEGKAKGNKKRKRCDDPDLDDVDAEAADKRSRHE